MSDTDGTTDKTDAPEDKPTETVDSVRAEVEKWKAMARKHEGQAKQNADAAKRLAEIEDSGKSEVERLTAQAKAESDRADKAEARALRLEVAATKGLTPTQARRLVGSTQEELEADADELLASFKPATGDSTDSGDDTEGDKPTGRPQERMRSGSTNEDEPLVTDPSKLIESLPRP